jgi:hypothetical protein
MPKENAITNIAAGQRYLISQRPICRILVVGWFVSGLNGGLFMRDIMYPAINGAMRVLTTCAILSHSSVVIYALFVYWREMRKRQAYITDPANTKAFPDTIQWHSDYNEYRSKLISSMRQSIS